MFYRKIIEKTPRQSYWKGFTDAFACFEYLYDAPKHDIITTEDISKMKRDTWCVVGNHMKKAIGNYKNDDRR